MWKNSLFIFVIMMAFSSCGDKPYYSHFEPISGETWSYDQKLTFPIEIKSVETLYDFKITVRTTTDYEYNNLWVFLSTETPDGQVVREPFEIKIANDDGSWIGEKSGTIVQTTLLFNSRKLPEAGTYTFTLEQGITEEKLKNILDIGFTVNENK